MFDKVLVLIEDDMEEQAVAALDHALVSVGGLMGLQVLAEALDTSFHEVLLMHEVPIEAALLAEFYFE